MCTVGRRWREGVTGSLTPALHHAGGRARLSRRACPLPGRVDHGHAALPRAVRAPGPWHHAARRLQRHQRLPAHRLLPPERGHGQCPATTHPWARLWGVLSALCGLGWILPTLSPSDQRLVSSAPNSSREPVQL